VYKVRLDPGAKPLPARAHDAERDRRIDRRPVSRIQQHPDGARGLCGESVELQCRQQPYHAPGLDARGLRETGRTADLAASEAIEAASNPLEHALGGQPLQVDPRHTRCIKVAATCDSLPSGYVQGAFTMGVQGHRACYNLSYSI